jgi:hypothetical protein
LAVAGRIETAPAGGGAGRGGLRGGVLNCPAMTTTQQLGWCLWIGGTALIIASWVRLVPNSIGWIGFVLAVIGACVPKTPRRRPPDASASEGENETDPV